MDFEIVVYNVEGFNIKRDAINQEDLSNNICIGEIVGSNKPYCIRVNEMLRHTLIVGTTGSGKTTTASIICSNLLKKGKKIVVLDWNGEYYEILKKLGVKDEYIVLFDKHNPLRINPFEYKSEENYEEYVEQIIDILESVLQLTTPQTYFLYQTFINKRKDISSFKALLETLSKETFDSEGYAGREAKYALVRKIRPLTCSTAKQIFSKTSNLETIFNRENYEPKIFIVDLSWITNTTLRKLYTLFLLKSVFDKVVHKSRNRSMLKYLIVIDEAHNILVENNELLQRIFSEIRKFGVGLVAISQSIIELPNYVIRNTNMKIFHAIRSFKDIKEVMGLMPPHANVQNILISLAVGETLIFDNISKYPVKVMVKSLD